MTISQTVEITDDRQLIINVPREVPSGPVILTFTPAPVKARAVPDSLPGGSYSTVEEAMEEAAREAADPKRKPISRLFGTLSEHTFGDPVAYQRAVRDEWD